MLFVMDADSDVFEGTENAGRLRKITEAFVALTLQPAFNKLPHSCNTARDGAKHMTYATNRRYRVYQADWEQFASLFSAVLQRTDLRTHCAMRYVRFYVCEHGLKMSREAGQVLLNSLIDMDHEHTDVIQIHHASNFSNRRDTSEALLIRLDRLSSLFLGQAL